MMGEVDEDNSQRWRGLKLQRSQRIERIGTRE